MRTTITKVRQIIETSISDTLVEGYIDSANAFVTDALGTTTLSEAIMAEIERWITAHMIAATRERQAISQKAGSAEQSFTDNYGLGLKLTSYGQQAIALDSSGILSAQSEGLKTFSITSIARQSS